MLLRSSSESDQFVAEYPADDTDKFNLDKLIVQINGKLAAHLFIHDLSEFGY
jgi:hypothetical protein